MTTEAQLPAPDAFPAHQADSPESGTSVHYERGRPFRSYLLWYTLAMIAFTAVWAAIGAIVLPNQIQGLVYPQFFTGANSAVDLQSLTELKQAVAAGTAVATDAQQQQLALLKAFEASKAQWVSIIASLGVVITMLIQPIVGVLSDRTRNRLGRRAPWILFGALVGSTALVIARFSPTLAVLAITFAVAQALLNMALAPLQATVADRVAEERRGLASALGGFGNFFGGLLGGVGAGVFFAVLGLNVYFVVAAGAVVTSVLFVIFARDRSSKDLVVPVHHWREFFVGFTIALRNSNFRWVWVARILLSFGYAVSTALSLYMLQSYIRPALSAAQATQTAPILILAGVPMTLITVFIAGRLSDRLHRRKPFVVTASILMAISMAVPLVSPTLPGLILQSMLAGIAFGIYLPVDQALFLDVLPDKRSAGRDLGVAAFGSNLGQALGPILAGAVVAVTGGYVGIWVAALVLVAFAAVAIVPVRGVR